MIKILGSHQTDVSSSANTHAGKTAKNWSIAPAMCLVTDNTILVFTTIYSLQNF